MAVLRLLSPQPLEQVGWGLALSIVSSGFQRGAGLGAVQRGAHAPLDRPGGGCTHLVTDVWTSAAVVVGVAGVALTGWLWLDPLLAIGVALNIVREGVKLVWRSSQGLMDQALDPETLALLNATLQRFAADTPEGRAAALRRHRDPRRRPAALRGPAHARARPVDPAARRQGCATSWRRR